MKFDELEKISFQESIQDLIKNRDSFDGAQDCYCALMKQIFLSKSTLN